jgi:hypothetical protein
LKWHVSCVKWNQLDTKGTACAPASVEQLPQIDGIVGDRKKLPHAVVVAITATAVFASSKW